MKKIAKQAGFWLFFVLFIGALAVGACTSTGKSGRKGADRELPQYTQKGWKNVKIVGGGLITGIIYNPGEKGLAYVRTDMGGAYRWNPENESWIPLTDFAGMEDWGQLGIASIATDPVETNRLIIAAGTYTNSWDPTNSQMLVSDNYGDTFTRVDLPYKMGANMPGRGAGERLVIDPNDSKIAYFGSNGFGLWRSGDYGHTWEEVKSFPTKGNVYDEGFAHWMDGHKHYHGIMWVLFDPASGTRGTGSKNIYAGVADTGYTIYESTDAGATWHPLEGQPLKIFDEKDHAHYEENCPCFKYYPIKGHFSPDGSLLTVWHACIGQFGSSFQGGKIWKYYFAEKKWEDISLPLHDYEEQYRTQDRGPGNVAVDWQNPKRLVAVTLNEWWPDEIIFRSTDGGKNWDRVWYMDGWPTRVNKYTVDISVAPWLDWGEQKAPPEFAPKIGWCMTALAIDPFNSNLMMYGTGATIYGTKNLTDWDRGRRVKFEVMAEGIEECGIHELVCPTEGAALISGMGDIGGFVHTDLNKVPPMPINPVMNGVNGIDYAASQPSYIVRMGNGQMGISTDFGKNWKPAHTSPDNKDQSWGGTIAISTDAKIIVCGPGERMEPCWTTDEGKTWTLCVGLPIGAKVISDRVNPNKFYAFGKPENGKDTVYMSTDKGKTFQVMNDNFIVGERTKIVFRAAIDHEDHLWIAAGDAGLYHSMDGGKTWEQFKEIESTPVIGLGKSAPDADYHALYTNAKINGKWGIFRSDDKGKTWIRINDDMHQFGAADFCITGDPRIYGRVFLATNGRGIQWRDLE